MDDLHPHSPPQAPVRSRPVDVRPPSRLRAVLWIGLVLLIAAGIYWWIHTRPVSQAPTGRFTGGGPMPVVIANAEEGDIAITYNALGTVTPLATVTVQTQIAGQITDVGFKEGQEVKKGDFLLQIDPRPFQAALDQFTGQLQRDQAMLNDAQTNLARYKKLAEQNSIARQQAEDQEYLVRQDEGTVKVDQALVDNANINLGYTRVSAPLAGRIGLRLVDPGNYVTVGNTGGIAVITQMQPISVIFTLPEDELPAVMKRLRSGATLTATASDRAGSRVLAQGSLSAVDSTIDTTTGTVRLRAEFPNEDEALFPNQFVNVRLLIDTQKAATVIPTAAVQRGQPGTFVYVAKADDTVSVQTIKLGPQDGERVAVQSGLKVGDRVVVDGADKLREGAKVSLRQESGAPAGATADKPQRQPGQRKSGGTAGSTGAAAGSAPATAGTPGGNASGGAGSSNGQ
jgi:membrane fusion protein, multidrug efflux system